MPKVESVLELGIGKLGKESLLHHDITAAMLVQHGAKRPGPDHCLTVLQRGDRASKNTSQGTRMQVERLTGLPQQLLTLISRRLLGRFTFVDNRDGTSVLDARFSGMVDAHT